LLLASGCAEDGADPAFGKLSINFEHMLNGQNVIYDDMRYINAAGNEYEVTEVQWFISDIVLVKPDGNEWQPEGEDFAHYVDTNLPETLVWHFSDQVPAGTYSAIKMTFGLKGEKNIPGAFPNQPESNMAWPINLGGDNGGYHYMKLNGFWKNTLGEREPFNFHLGVGPRYDESGNVKEFVQNWFEITIPNSSFSIAENESLVADLSMNIRQWFDDPYVWDHNIYGGKIMKNQDAMAKGSANGANGVFRMMRVRPPIQINPNP
jgi:hypothetical protein